MTKASSALGRFPELPLAAFGFVLHFFWEVVQCPYLFVGMGGSSHADGVRMCLQATVGDVNILLFAFWMTALASRRHRDWMVEPRRWEQALFVAIGVLVTVGYELLATRVWHRWAYSGAMPVLFGVGLAPVAQWLVIPPIVLRLVRRRAPAPIVATLLAIATIVGAVTIPLTASAQESIRERAAPPGNLDELVELAASRDPAAQASAWDADAARARASGARQPMSPQLMLGIDSLGAPMDDPDPTMWMAGVSQMLPGWGELRAQSRRFAVDAERAGAERERIAADLRLRLWQSSARLEAFAAEKALLDEQIGEADALKSVALVRYRNVPGSAPGSGSMPGAVSAEESPSMPFAAPRRSDANAGARAANGGMAGMSGGGTAMTARVSTPGGDMGSMEGGTGMTATGMASDGSLAGLLRLDVTVERLRAERASLEARLAGEISVLSLYVGEEAAIRVAGDPIAFRGAPRTAAGVPEKRLAELDRDAAAADLALARARRRPDVMWSVAARVMPPEGEFAGVNASVGIALPIWGGLGRQIAASRRDVAAADARRAAVDRDLAAAVLNARASLDAARVRREAVEKEVLPRAEASYIASRKSYSGGRGSINDALLAWDTLIQIKREQVAARRDVELRTAELSRLEAR